jgi:hypothetical protein
VVLLVWLRHNLGHKIVGRFWVALRLFLSGVPVLGVIGTPFPTGGDSVSIAIGLAWYTINCPWCNQYERADYTLSSLRYDLWKLRAKALIQKIPHSRRYQLLPNGYQICVLFLKLFEKLYAPLTAGILQPFAADKSVPSEKTSPLDHRYQAVVQALDHLVEAVGLKVA